MQRQGRVHVVVLGDEERGHLPAARLALHASIVGAVESGKMCGGGGIHGVIGGAVESNNVASEVCVCGVWGGEGHPSMQRFVGLR